MKQKPCILGIDIGTTSLSAILMNAEDKRIEYVFSTNTEAYLPSDDLLIREQSVERLTQLFRKLLSDVKAMPDVEIVGYGFTGQMHGVIGLDKEGQAVTNLATWEDRSGERLSPDGSTLLDQIKRLSGDETISCGYGIVALYKWLVVEGREDIAFFCTIADYFVRLLTDRVAMSPTMAHSIGLFDAGENEWQIGSIERLGINPEVFPEIVPEASVVGYADSVPVVVAIGDNQASFQASVLNKKNSLLLNIGTGAQISTLIDKCDYAAYSQCIDGSTSQLRPYNNDYLLMATSFVNGGSAYKLLHVFFQGIARDLFDIETIDEDRLWQNMEAYARENMTNGSPLQVSPLFFGERNDPEQKGRITDITPLNFTHGSFTLALLTGLIEYYKSALIPDIYQKTEQIYGSGNGLKRNKLLVEIVEKVFQKPILLTSYNEEAAIGAVLNAATGMGYIRNEADSRAFLSNLFTSE